MMRRNTGSILFLTIALSTLIASGIVLVMAALMVLNSQKIEQMQTDSMAIEMAKLLNEGDRIGELNNVISYSRECVYTSRKTYETIHERYPHLEDLAEIMLDDARHGAQLVERERSILRGQIVSELKVTAKRHNSGLQNLPQVEVWFLQVKAPEIKRIELGVVRDVASNAQAPAATHELAQFDRGNGYFFGGSQFYRANVDARLPAPDNDLPFKISALAPPVEQTLAPARLILGDALTDNQVIVGDSSKHRKGSDWLPSALQLEMSMPIRVAKDHHDVRTVSNAATSGGAPAL